MQGRNQDFAKGGGGLKIEHFCDVILITYFRWRDLMSHQNDVIIDIFGISLCNNKFVRPQIGQITQLRITKTQKIQYI